MFRVSILLSTVTILLLFGSKLTPKYIENMSANNFFITGVLNASDPSRTECFMSLKEENTVNMISMFYLHHAVENAVSTRLLY